MDGDKKKLLVKLLSSPLFEKKPMLELPAELASILQSYGFILAILLLVIIHLALEALFHSLNLRKIAIRIHVNGSQGKSTVTRLIAAGLKKQGFVVCAKTAGALPCFIRPDGTEQAIYRSSGSDIMELAKIVRTAASFKPQVFIISCSTTKPESQSLAELKFIRSTHGVITNILEQRLETMGPTRADVALALAGTMPIKGRLYTPEQHHLSILRMAARDRGSKIILIKPQGIAKINQQTLERFSYIEYVNHLENIALAIKVCKDLGVSEETALQGMCEAAPDPEAITIQFLLWETQPIIFVNAFAVNDELDASELWTDLSKKYPECKQSIILFNCRGDRKERSVKFAKMINRSVNIGHVFVLGGNRNLLIDNLAPRIDYTDAGKWEPIDILNQLVKLSTDTSSPLLVIGMGNITGAGFKIFEYFTHVKHTSAIRHQE